MKSFFVAAAIMFTSFLRAERAPYKMEDVLQNTQLIVYAQIHTHTEKDVTIKVNDVLFNYRTGIQREDYLRIPNDFSIVCPVEIPRAYAEQKRKGVFFLHYARNTWHLTMGEAVFMTSETAKIGFTQEGYFYEGTLPEWKKDLKDYYAHFPRNQENKLTPQLDSIQWASREGLSPLVQLQYKTFYNAWNLDLSQHKRLTRYQIVEPKEETPYETLQSSPGVQVPISPEKMMQISDEIAERASTQYPELLEKQIKGFTYYSLYFNDQGKIDKVKIDLAVHGLLNNALETYFDEHNLWPAAINKNGVPIRFRQRLFMRFNPQINK